MIIVTLNAGLPMYDHSKPNPTFHCMIIVTLVSMKGFHCIRRGQPRHRDRFPRYPPHKISGDRSTCRIGRRTSITEQANQEKKKERKKGNKRRVQLGISLPDIKACPPVPRILGAKCLYRIKREREDKGKVIK